MRIAAERTGPRAGLSFRVTGSSQLPFPDDAFDIVHSSMVLHHLEPDEATDLLRESARVGRLGVIVNDLDRARRFWLGAWLIGHLTTRNRYTGHDAPLSVRRAYRPTEVERMATSAGMTRVAHFRGFMGHRYALVFASPAAETGQPSLEHG